ncbi:MAG: flagellar hook-associated protein FlgL [Vicinamibacterales bacterium]
MRVTFNTGMASLLHEVNGVAERLKARQLEVATGKRVQVPSDDPAATVGIVSENATVQTLDRFARTADSAEARLRVTDSVLTNLVDELQSALTQAAAGRNSTLTQESRNATALAIAGLRDSILSTVNTQYQGGYLFSGGRSTTAPYTKTGSTVSGYQGDTTIVSVDISRSRSVAVTVNGDAVLRGTDASDVFSVLTSLATAVQNGDSNAIDQGIGALNRAFTRATEAQSRVGTDLAAIAEEQARLGETKRASNARRATLEDANLAEAISGMNAAQQSQQATLAVLGQTNRLSLLDYLR